MSGKIPHDAFDHYVSLGAERSHRAVADHYGVTKRAVTKCASREDWSQRMNEIERKARTAADKELGETLGQQKARHLKLLRAMGSRVAQGLKEYPITSGMDAIRAAETVIKLERLIVGEASDRTAVSVEETTRNEVWNLLHREPDLDSSEDDGEEGHDDDW